MIFTECPKCHEPFVYGYEAGEEPCGKGVFGLHVCDKCGQRCCVERVSSDGETITEEELYDRGGKDLTNLADTQ